MTSNDLPFILNLTDYQPLAESTALPTAYSLDYIIPAIYGETAEVVEKLGKAQRDSRDEEWLCSALADEYGDICWAVAVGLKWYGVTVENDFNPVPEKIRWDAVSLARRDHARENMLDLLTNMTSSILKRYWAIRRTPEIREDSVPGGEDAPDFRDFFQRLWWFLRVACQPITGHTFAEVLAINVVKLRSRQERGVIGGDGDYR